MVKVMMVACNLLILWESLQSSSHIPGKTQPQDSCRKARCEVCMEGICMCGQPEGGALVDSSGPGLLSQLDLFLEISFPDQKQSTIPKRGWNLLTSIDPAPSIVPDA